MKIRPEIPEGIPAEHVEVVRRVAGEVRRSYIGGTSWRKCHGAAIDVVEAFESDTQARALGIVVQFQAGDFDERSAHCWARVMHPTWPEPLIVDVTIDQFDMEGTMMKFRRPRRYPRIYIGANQDEIYWSTADDLGEYGPI